MSVFNYEKVVAKTLFGLEPVLAKELRDLGAENIKVLNRAVEFSTGKAGLYKMVYNLRSAIRVLVPLAEFKAYNPHALYRGVKNIPWSQVFSPDQSFKINATVNSKLYAHTKFPALKAKDAIVDKFRERYEKRPDVAIDNPDIVIDLYISEENCVVSADASGYLLYRRGYKTLEAPAPLNEVLAFGLIMLSEWDKETPLYDPMCGTGTIGIEAALYALNIPPQSFTSHFAFMNWQDYVPELWDRVKDDSESKILSECPKIFCSDTDGRSLGLARSNAKDAGVLDHIHFERADFFKVKPPKEKMHTIINPPYGERLDDLVLQDFYADMGDKFKQDFKGNSVFVFSGSLPALKSVGLKADKKTPLYNGKLEAQLRKYSIFEGRRIDQLT